MGPLFSPYAFFSRTQTPHPLRAALALAATLMMGSGTLWFLAPMPTTPAFSFLRPLLALAPVPLVILSCLAGMLLIYRFVGHFAWAATVAIWTWVPLGVIASTATFVAMVDTRVAIGSAALAAPIWGMWILQGALHAWQVRNVRNVILWFVATLYVAPNVLMALTLSVILRVT